MGNVGRIDRFMIVATRCKCLFVNVCSERREDFMRPVVCDCWFISHISPLIVDGTKSQGTRYLGNGTLLIYR